MLAEAGRQIHGWFEGWSTQGESTRAQTIRPSCRRAALSLAALCVGRSYHHPYLTGGETQGPEGKAASLRPPGRAQSRIQPSLLPPGCSLQEMLVPWQWVTVKKQEISWVRITVLCIKKYDISKDTPKCFSGPESIQLKFNSKKMSGFLKRIFFFNL